MRRPLPTKRQKILKLDLLHNSFTQPRGGDIPDHKLNTEQHQLGSLLSTDIFVGGLRPAFCCWDVRHVLGKYTRSRQWLTVDKRDKSNDPDYQPITIRVHLSRTTWSPNSVQVRYGHNPKGRGYWSSLTNDAMRIVQQFLPNGTHYVWVKMEETDDES